MKAASKKENYLKNEDDLKDEDDPRNKNNLKKVFFFTAVGL